MKPEKSKIRKIQLPRKISRQRVNCEQVRFSCNLSVFVSRFQQSPIRELRKIFGQETCRPPKSESSRTPMILVVFNPGHKRNKRDEMY